MPKVTIQDLIKSNRLLEMLTDDLLASPFYDATLYQRLCKYTEDYIEQQHKGEKSVDKIYFNFIKAYNKDMKAFDATSKYPLELDSKREAPDRYAYNIILLFSCLFTSHRFRIMQLIQNRSHKVDTGLFIGCGPGMEIDLIKGDIDTIFAYDLTMDEFLFNKHPKVSFKQEYFDGKNDDQKYDQIYLIELLEHLSNPYDLLQICKNVMTDNGQVFLTTATNIPQFDHLYNFKPDHLAFDDKIADMGFNIDYYEDIPHASITLDVKAKNRFYILTKK